MKHMLSKEGNLFRTTVENCSIDVTSFDHRAHLRLAYTYLVDHSPDEATTRVRETLTALLRHNQIEPSAKYHETLTKAWLLTVRHFMDHTQASNSAAAFIERNPFLAPDLAPIPMAG